MVCTDTRKRWRMNRRWVDGRRLREPPQTSNLKPASSIRDQLVPIKKELACLRIRSLLNLQSEFSYTFI